MTQLVLSLFPGVGLLDRAFEEEGFCIVRGPDVLWGGDVRKFHPPAGRFDGVIGGPPCQMFSKLRHLLEAQGRTTEAVNLIPEFCRCVAAAAPIWFLMENVCEAPDPRVKGYKLDAHVVVDWKAGGKTQRKRRFWFGDTKGRQIAIDQSCQPVTKPARAVHRCPRVPTPEQIAEGKAKGGILPGTGKSMPIKDVCELQGLPRDFATGSQFKMESLRIMLGNGVPLPMGRAIAKAVRETIENLNE